MKQKIDQFDYFLNKKFKNFHSKNFHKQNIRNTLKSWVEDFPGGAVDKNLPANAGNIGSVPGLRRCYMPQSN